VSILTSLVNLLINYARANRMTGPHNFHECYIDKGLATSRSDVHALSSMLFAVMLLVHPLIYDLAFLHPFFKRLNMKESTSLFEEEAELQSILVSHSMQRRCNGM
jgi:hypothetical protein